jgi:type III secretion protein L
VTQTGLAPKNNKVIEREVVGARQEAGEIRRRAEEEAQRIVDEANEQAYEIRQRGFEEGKQEGFAQHTKEIATALLKVREIENGLEAEYIGLVKACCAKIIGQELKQHAESIVGVVRSALAEARQQREIIVRVNPYDVEALEKSKGKLLEMLARANVIEIRPDASVTRGGCVVATELGTIDATLERQLDALAQALGAEMAEGGASFDDDGGDEAANEEQY